MINEILLRRKNKLLFENVKMAFNRPNEDNIQLVVTIMKNIESLGYTFSADLIDFLGCLDEINLRIFYLELVPQLKKLVGANVEYNPFYENFPTEVMKMEEVQLYINAIIAYLTDCEVLLHEKKKERTPLFEGVELKIIDFGSDDDLRDVFINLVSSKTSISQQDKEDIAWCFANKREFLAYLPEEIPFKENVALISKLYLDNTEFVDSKVIAKYFKTATDVLRFITCMSDGDISLAENTKFKSMKRKHRRLVLELLENCGNIEEDMLRYKNRWIRVGEVLHPREYPRYTKVNIAFDKLRENKHIDTFASKVEELLLDKNVVETAGLLISRPGEFARRLDQLLRMCVNEIDVCRLVINNFYEVADEISIPVLLQLKEHFKYRGEDNTRVFFPKGQMTKAYTRENNLESIPSDVCQNIISICEDAIIEQLSCKEQLGKVYISDSMKGFVIPQSQRSASKDMKNITRCSRFKINDNHKFIRLGIHWMNEIVDGRERSTDIDLSCNFLDENFRYRDHVSYTHLRNSYSTHSGDLTSAPRDKGGAAEFLDLDINGAIEKGIRYAAIQVYGYTNTKFCDLDDMVFNWQSGVEAIDGDIFEPSRVQQNINLTANTMCSIPVVFDLVNREVIWCDIALTTQTNFPRCVEGNIRGLSASVMGICNAHKTTMVDLIALNVIARGSLVADRNDADIIFDTDVTKPTETVHVVIKNEKGEVTEEKDEERVKDNVKIITPYDTEYFSSELM